MNYNSNAALLTGRNQQQQQQQPQQQQNPQQQIRIQQHQAAPAATPSSVQSGGTIPQKTGNMSNTSPQFPISNQQQQQQGASGMQQKLNDEKQAHGVASTGHQHPQQSIHPASRNNNNNNNNNNHGMGGIPQQLINLPQHQQQQQQQNINRNANITSHQQINKNVHQMTTSSSQQQSSFHQQQIMTSISQVTDHKMNLLQQMNQFTSYQQQQMLPSHQNMQHSTVSQSQQSILQKIQATLPPAMQQAKPHVQQQGQQHLMSKSGMTYAGSQSPHPPSSVSSSNHPQTAASATSNQHMQYSPTKPGHQHPQMKTTAKLASPGSQLQTLQQKSPTQQPTSGALPAQNQQASQNKNVPSSTTVSSVNSTVAPGSNVTTATAPSASILQQAVQAVSNSSKSQTSSSSSSSSSSLSSASPQLPIAAATTIALVAPAPVPTLVSPPLAVNNATPAQNTQANSVPSTTPVTSTASPSKPPQPEAASTAVQATNDQAVKVSTEQPIKELAELKVPAVNSSAQSKTSPVKPTEEKKAAIAKNCPLPLPADSANKTEKPSSVVVEKPPTPSSSSSSKAAASVTPAVVATSVPPSKLRLATVTPPRKKPPPTITKKVVAPVRSIVNPPKESEKIVVAKATSEKSPETVKLATLIKKQESSSKSNSSGPATVVATTSPPSNVTPKTKRVRTKVQPYQSPTPEIALVTKLSTQIANPSKNGAEDKLIIFYKNEFLAVRNGEGGFYLCQTMHNVYKSSPKIRIRWLNERDEGKVNETGGRVYNLDFYDHTDFECVLTTVDLDKIDTKTFELPKEELGRIESILKKAIDVEKGVVPRPAVDEQNPDGLDLSLYKDESQLDKISSRKRKSNRNSYDDDDDEEDEDDDDDDEPLKKKSTKTPLNKKINTPRLSTRKAPVVDASSSESDEENLMEIKKKTKNQQTITKQEKNVSPKKAEPIPSTSKDLGTPVKAGRGRKRAADKPLLVEKSPKVAKPAEKITEDKQPEQNTVVAATKSSPKTKTPKKIENIEIPEKKVDADVKKVTKEKKANIEKKQPVKKTPIIEPSNPATKIIPENPKAKKKNISDKVTNTTKTKDVSLELQANVSPTTTKAASSANARARNTRSKK